MKLAFLIPAMLFSFAANAQVRSVFPRQDEITTIKSALGIATIIQLPETIQSAIIGDQSGFKVEYLDKAVTIKPLRYGVKTNLYLVTDKRRYSLRLLTLGQDSADFIVYVKAPEAKESVTWRVFNKVSKNKTGTLTVTRVGRSQQGFILLDVTLTPTQDMTLRPEDIWVTQKNSSKVINGLYLSETRLQKNKSISIGVCLAKSDLDSRLPLILQIKNQIRHELLITEGVLWR